MDGNGNEFLKTDSIKVDEAFAFRRIDPMLDGQFFNRFTYIQTVFAHLNQQNRPEAD